jgi:hypothetical protein
MIKPAGCLVYGLRGRGRTTKNLRWRRETAGAKGLQLLGLLGTSSKVTSAALY